MVYYFENLRAKCTWCDKEMKKEIFEEEGITKARLICKEDPECELSQVIIWIDPGGS